MCREQNREPIWVAAIRLAYLNGVVDKDGIVEEANLIPGRDRTIYDVLSTMADRGILKTTPGDEERYVAGPSLLESDRLKLAFDRASDGGIHRRPAYDDLESTA